MFGAYFERSQRCVEKALFFLSVCEFGSAIRFIKVAKRWELKRK